VDPERLLTARQLLTRAVASSRSRRWDIFSAGPSGISSTTANALRADELRAALRILEGRLPSAGARREPGRFNKRVDQILRHVTAVLPQFALACLVLAALPGPATALFRSGRHAHRAGPGPGRRDPLNPVSDPGQLSPCALCRAAERAAAVLTCGDPDCVP
jgi:hypothetical protein